MPGPSNTPVFGRFVFDGSEFDDYAKDLPPGGCLGMLTAREGFLEVCEEMLAAHAEWGAKAGIANQEISDLQTVNTRIARIDIFLPAFIKAAEILTETRYALDDQRQRIVFDAAQSIDRRVKRHPELLARYERTRAYRSAIAKKALRTRARNAEAPPAGENKPQKPPTPTPATTTPATPATPAPATPATTTLTDTAQAV